MRLVSSIRNAYSSLLLQIAAILLGLLSQAVFIRYLGIQYAGVSGVLSNIISMLSLAELGVGTAMVYSLYEPLAKGNVEKVKSLMGLYRRVYQIIGIVIGCSGLLILPFTSYFFKNLTVDVNLNLVFLFYLLNTVISYFYTYKRSLLYADQKDYLNKFISFGSLAIMNILQISTLMVFKNYYIYLAIRIIVMIGENVFVSHIVNKKYPFLRCKTVQPIEKEEKGRIVSNIKALFFHKIGGFVVLGTGNLIVSSLISVTAAGIFGTYQLLTKNLMGIGSVIIDSVTASFGNLLALEREKSYTVFNKLFYFNFALATITGCCLLTCLHPFMQLFAGPNNVFAFSVELIIVVEYYIHSMRVSIGVGKNAAGLYRPDRFVPLWESFVNLAASLLLVRLLGVAGVILGMILSTLLSVFISVPYLTFRYVYQKPLILYYKMYLYYFIIALICGITSFGICYISAIPNYFLEFVKNGVLSVMTSGLLIFFITHRREEFKYFIVIFWKLLNRKLSPQV